MPPECALSQLPVVIDRLDLLNLHVSDDLLQSAYFVLEAAFLVGFVLLLAFAAVVLGGVDVDYLALEAELGLEFEADWYLL